MKYCIAFSVVLIFISCINQEEFQEVKPSAKVLATNESKLLVKLDFDASLMSELRQQTESDLVQLASIDDETSDILDSSYNGAFTVCKEEKAATIVNTLKEKFRKHGYLIFSTEDSNGSVGIAVIKGSNDLEILHYRKPNGINYDLESKDILNKIARWKEKYGLSIIGCSGSWVEIQFHRLPDDLDAFTEEVYAFCPDIVDQGVLSIENLKEYIKETGGLWLWWD